MANADTTDGVQNPSGTRKHMDLRKRLKLEVMRKYPGRVVAWQGGILYFIDSRRPQKVPGVMEVPKPGQKVLSFRAANGPIQMKYR